MTHKITASLLALAFLASAASIVAPASAQEGRKSASQNTRNSIGLSQARIAIRRSDSQQYRAGLRAGLDPSGRRARASYERGYGDASYRQAYYGPRLYNGGYAQRVYRGYAYADYDGYGPRYPGYGPYAQYNGDYDRSGSYGPYSIGLNPIAALVGGLAGLPFAGAPVPLRAEQRNPEWLAYCFSKYRSFDERTGTFLANDGNRYYCS